METNNMAPSTRKEFFEVRIYVTGVKKRCRKIERVGIAMDNAPLDIQANHIAMDKIAHDAHSLIIDKLKQYNLESAQIVFTYAYTDSRIEGMTTSHPFHESNFKINLFNYLNLYTPPVGTIATNNEDE